MARSAGPSTGLAAVVVAGGASRRMGGVDKLALDVAGRPLLDRVLGAAAAVCDPVVVVGPARPTGVAGVVTTREPVPGGGPVPAVAAGVACTPPSADVLVIAADLPLLAAAHLRLLAAALAGVGVTTAAALDHRGPNPLLAAHRRAALGERLGALGPDLSGVAAARLLPPDVTVVDLGPDAVLNVNRPDDLQRARALASRRP